MIKLKTIGFFVCSNGFGHFKRSLRIAQEIIKINDLVYLELFCTKNQIDNHQNWFLFKNLNQSNKINFVITSDNLKISYDSNISFSFDANFFESYKKKIKNYDIVLSDNLSHILKIRHDTILIGSFLWSNALKITDSNYYSFKKSEISLLNKYKPNMIAVRGFAMTSVKEYTNPIYIDWPVLNAKTNTIKKSLRNILVIGGGTNIINDKLSFILNKLLVNENFNIHTSKGLSAHKSNLKHLNIFNFNENEFNKIDIIIARAGMGTLTDCVKYGIPILGISESDNFEIKYNCEMIEKYNYGLNISNNYKNILEIINNINNSEIYTSFQKSLKKAKKNGITQAADYILKYNRNGQ